MHVFITVYSVLSGNTSKEVGPGVVLGIRVRMLARVRHTEGQSARVVLK
jgi:hypothetical protein